uniref:NAC transcription factor 91 n=1 Tax=Litchi chinensis TaxID=151069 RepID=A0A8K1HZH1_LITCN|nr:NAC transcription factor 91 [Litchi chinensis]
MAFPVGHIFQPTDKQLVGYYLFNKLFTQPSPFTDGEKSLVKDFDLYGCLEPWEIWQLHGGDDLEDEQFLYFFTSLKKASVKGSRICRRVGSGTWAGEDSGEKIKAGDVVAFKKRFRYENKHSPHNGAWIMHEFTIHSAPTVLCRIKKNPRAADNKRKLKEATFKQSKRCKTGLSVMQQSQRTLLDAQYNMLQSPMTTPQAESDTNSVDADDSFLAYMMKLPPLSLLSHADRYWVDEEDVLQSVVISSRPDGGDWCCEDVMKNISLPDEITCHDVTNF